MTRKSFGITVFWWLRGHGGLDAEVEARLLAGDLEGAEKEVNAMDIASESEIEAEGDDDWMLELAGYLECEGAFALCQLLCERGSCEQCAEQDGACDQFQEIERWHREYI